MLTDLPAIPVFEFFVGAVIIVGVLYYLLSGQRGKEDVEQLAADEATGETVIARSNRARPGERLGAPASEPLAFPGTMRAHVVDRSRHAPGATG